MLFLAEDFCGEEPELGSFVGVHIEAGFKAEVAEEGFAIPALLGGDLGKEDALMEAFFENNAVDARDDVFGRGGFPERAHDRDFNVDIF